MEKIKKIKSEHLSLDFGVSEVKGDNLFETFQNIENIIEQAERRRRKQILQIVK